MTVTRRAALAFSALAAAQSAGAAAAPRKMKIALVPGSISLQLTQDECIELGKKYGFEAVEPYGVFLAQQSPDKVDAITAKVKAMGLEWGQAGLPVDYRKDQEKFDADVAKLPTVLKALQRAGVTRMGTWVMPFSATMTYLQNMQFHVSRIKPVAKMAADHGIRLGLEYIGPRTLLNMGKYPFVHTLAEMRDLIGAIGEPNVGVVLDTWHWYCAGETVEDLMTLKNSEIVSVDLNDAPAGVPVAQQIDSARELPLDSGVIDIKGFLTALNAIGCDAPVRCEPFYAPLKTMAKERVLERVADRMVQSMRLIAG